MALVFVLCAVNYLYAVILSTFVLKQGEDQTKWSYYAVSSFTYLAAMAKEKEQELKKQWSENAQSRRAAGNKYGF